MSSHRHAINLTNPCALVIKCPAIKQGIRLAARSKSTVAYRAEIVSLAGAPSVSQAGQLVTQKHLTIFHDREVKHIQRQHTHQEDIFDE
jgi:hypothetical protein